VKRFLYLATLSLLSVAGFYAGSPSGDQPVYVYLYARVTDHVNLDVSEDRLRHVLPMIERYRKTHPEEHVSATILFSGSVSQAFAERNSQTHILDFVQDFVHRGVIEPGYDGTDEPTYKRRPSIDLAKTKTAEERWLARGATAEAYLTEARDPLTGAPLPGKSGGLKKMQESFGPASCITGLTLAVPDPAGLLSEVGVDAETVHELSRYNTSAIMFGVLDGNPVHAPEYRDWSAAFSKDLSPAPDTPPELFWQDNILRSSESSDADNRLFRASGGAEAFRKVAEKLDRSKIRIIHAELASPRNYVTEALGRQTPLGYAYAHPEQPALPPELRRAAAQVDAAYAKEETFLKFLADDYFPAHPGDRFVSSADLKHMAGPSTGYSVPVAALRSELAEVMKTWGSGTTPPKYLRVDGHYLSMADMFQVMTDALAELNRTGQLPQSVRVTAVYGPTETTRDSGLGQGEVSVASVARVCAGLTERLHDTVWTPNPKNSIPFRVVVDGIDLNAAQFLRLMAEAVVNPSPEAKLQVKTTEMFWGRNAIYYRTRSTRDLGATWTYKPAVLEVAAAK
jgi:hypothetical protein